MSTPTIKTKVAIDGEKEYKAAITEINTGLRTLGSEMNLVRTRFAENSESVEALTAKQDLLSRTLSTQKEKVEALRNALQNSATEHGEADSRTQKWQQSLNRAEAELINTQRELDATTAAMENQGGTMVGLGTGLDNITGKFGVNLPEGLKNTLDSVMQVDGGMLELISTAAAVAVAVYKVVDALAEMTTEAAASADEILTLNMVTGLTTDAVQELQYVSELIDVSFETMQSSMSRLTRNMGEAADGSGEAQAKFDKLGLSIYGVDGRLKSSEEMFYEVIDVLGAIDDATARDAAAMDLMGRSAQDLNPLIMQGSEVLKAYRQEAHDTGYVLDSDMLASLGAVDDSMQRLQASQENARNQLALHFAPALTEFYEEFGRLTRDWGEDAADSGLVEFFGSILELITALLPLLSALGDIVAALAPAFKALGVVLAAVADVMSIIANLAGAVVNLLRLDFAGAGENLGNAWSTLTTNDSATSRALGSFNASGDMNFGGGLTRVGEAGPETVYLPHGSRIYSNQESGNMGGNVWYVTINARDVKEFNDIVRLSQSARRRERMGK